VTISTVLAAIDHNVLESLQGISPIGPADVDFEGCQSDGGVLVPEKSSQGVHYGAGLIDQSDHSQ
jgi:hypothetical protein